MNVSRSSRQAPRSLAGEVSGACESSWGGGDSEGGLRSRQDGASLRWGLGSGVGGAEARPFGDEGRPCVPPRPPITPPQPPAFPCAPTSAARALGGGGAGCVIRAPESLLWVHICSMWCACVCTSQARAGHVNTCVCVPRVMTRLGTSTCVCDCDCMKPRFLFALVCRIQVCVLLGHTCVFVFCMCAPVRACACGLGGVLAGLCVGGSGGGMPGSGGPAEKRCSFSRPRRRVLLSRQPAAVSGAFRSRHPLPPVPDPSGPEAS